MTEKQKAYNKQYRETHKLEIAEYNKAYRASPEYKARVVKYRQEFFQKNKTRVVAQRADYRATWTRNNKDKVNKARSERYKNSPKAKATHANCSFRQLYGITLADKEQIWENKTDVVQLAMTQSNYVEEQELKLTIIIQLNKYVVYFVLIVILLLANYETLLNEF